MNEKHTLRLSSSATFQVPMSEAHPTLAERQRWLWLWLHIPSTLDHRPHRQQHWADFAPLYDRRYGIPEPLEAIQYQ